MQCQIRAMNDNKAAAISDTLPKRGRVNQVCREWLVHEDGALAYQLQQQEVHEHLTGNRSRNAIVRGDFPKALDEQRREELDAYAKYEEEMLIQERDAKVARQLSEEMQKEETWKRRMLEQEDQRMARTIQEKEKKKNEVKAQVQKGDINSVGLPLPEEMPTVYDITNQLSWNMNLEDKDEASTSWPPPPSNLELGIANRTEQEKRDEELARRLQEEEENGLDMVDRDRLIAIEAQDKELAKMLQEKERAKVRRARERAKARALAKKQMEEEIARNDIAPLPEESHTSRSRTKTRPGDEDEIEVLPSTLASPNGGAVPNIAMAIDPTYSHQKFTKLPTPPASYSSNDYEAEEEGMAPPYMPVQGQRRSSSLEKKRKKDKTKEGCKQQ